MWSARKDTALSYCLKNYTFIFAQDDLVYLLKMSVLFKFYRHQTFSVEEICQLNLIATSFNRQIVTTFFFSFFFFSSNGTNDLTNMYYLYFRFWLSTVHCLEILFYIRLLFRLGLVWSNLLVEKLYKSHHNKLLFQETDEKFMFQTATIIINEIWPISRIISQGSSSSLEAQVPTWLYVQFHESHNCNTGLILSIDRVILKGIQ